ncbi:MAG: CBS domain-containing protein [Xanthobacteraceae bacterium]|nr:CBS domain-containing protein [Xanthobacteraceae bacterium]
MQASDVMGVNVVTVGPESSIQQAAAVMLEKGISGLPVVSKDNRLVGIVSEGDLMRRADAGTGRRHSWWLRMLMGRDGLAREYVREHAFKVEDVMTRAVITAEPSTSLGEIADLLERNRIKRVPIVEGDKLVGVVSRANIVQAVASCLLSDRATNQTDATLRERVLSRFEGEPWAQTCLINVTVSQGTADLWGIAESDAQKQAFRVAAEATPGIRAVNDNLLVREVASTA